MKLIPATFLATTLATTPSPVLAEESPDPARLAFAYHELTLGQAERQTVLTGFVTAGDVADLCVVYIDENGGRQLKIFKHNGDTWVAGLKTKLRPGVRFVDIARIDGKDRLLTYESERLNWFNPDTAAEEKLASVAIQFQPPRDNEIPFVDISVDLNEDGRDELVIPSENGFKIRVQERNGKFAEPVSVGLAPDLNRIMGADGYRYRPWLQSRIHSADWNSDGRNDLAYWHNQRFHVHLQDEHGRFFATAKTFTSQVVIDTDNPAAFTTGDGAARVLHSLTDLNGDGVADLMIHSIEGKRISKKRSSLEVHLGRTTDGGTTFAPNPVHLFQTKNHIQLGTQLHDYDGDGRPDLMVTTIQKRFLTGNLWKRLKGFMGDDLWLELQFYRNNEGQFSTEPDTTARVALIGAPSHQEPGWVPLNIVLNGATHKNRLTQKGWQRAFNTNLLIGDVTGDGRSELLIERTFRGLSVRAGVPGGGLFAGQSQSVRHIVPHDEEYTRLVDLNRDGKQDILMHHPFSNRDIHGGRIQADETEHHRLTILLTK